MFTRSMVKYGDINRSKSLACMQFKKIPPQFQWSIFFHLKKLSYQINFYNFDPKTSLRGLEI